MCIYLCILQVWTDIRAFFCQRFIWFDRQMAVCYSNEQLHVSLLEVSNLFDTALPPLSEEGEDGSLRTSTVMRSLQATTAVPGPHTSGGGSGKRSALTPMSVVSRTIASSEACRDAEVSVSRVSRSHVTTPAAWSNSHADTSGVSSGVSATQPRADAHTGATAHTTTTITSSGGNNAGGGASAKPAADSDSELSGLGDLSED